MNDFSCHSNTLSLYPVGKTKLFKVWWNELTQLDLCWAYSNWFSILSSIDFMVHPQLVFFPPYDISLIISNKLAASEGIKVHLYFLSLRQMKSWLWYYFIWLHCLSYIEWCPVKNGSMNLDITTQLFYLMISMLRTSCGTVIHAPAAAECPTADECRCYVSHTHLESPNICWYHANSHECFWVEYVFLLLLSCFSHVQLCVTP